MVRRGQGGVGRGGWKGESGRRPGEEGKSAGGSREVGQADRGWSKRELRSWTNAELPPPSAELHLLPAALLQPPLSAPALLLRLCLHHVSCSMFMFRYVCVLSGRCISLQAWSEPKGVETIARSRKHEILIMFIMPKGFVSRRCTHTHTQRAHVSSERAVRVVSCALTTTDATATSNPRSSHNCVYIRDVCVCVYLNVHCH